MPAADTGGVGRYGFMVGILGAVVALALFAWRLSAVADAMKTLPAGTHGSPGSVVEWAGAAGGPLAQADQAGALARVQQAVVVAEVYAAERGTYADLTTEALRELDPTLDPSVAVVGATDAAYCVEAGYGSSAAHATGPGLLAPGPCP